MFTLTGSVLTGSFDNYHNNRLRERSALNVSENFRSPLPKQEQCGGGKSMLMKLWFASSKWKRVTLDT